MVIESGTSTRYNKTSTYNLTRVTFSNYIHWGCFGSPFFLHVAVVRISGFISNFAARNTGKRFMTTSFCTQTFQEQSCNRYVAPQLEWLELYAEGILSTSLGGMDNDGFLPGGDIIIG